MNAGEIKNKLSPAQVSVMMHKVTEPPYFGRFWDHFEEGTYRCAACATPLFSSQQKFDSKTGWPSFKKPLNEKDLQFKSEQGPDDKVEIRCKKCKSHLGYVIAGDTPYYRINSVCLVFESTPVETVTAPASEQLKAPVVFPEPVTTSVAPMNETSSWKLAPILVGMLAGIIIGVGATAHYLSPAAPAALTDTASTTAETASSSPSDTSTPETDTQTNTTPAQTTERASAPTQETPTESAQTQDSTATSTQ